jgi:tetratricopeptide (TPR) repeat protein
MPLKISDNQANFLKLAASCGAASLGFMLDPTGTLTGTAKFLDTTLIGVATNFIHQYLGVCKPKDLFRRLNAPDRLNHDIEKLMVASVPKTFEELQKKYQDEHGPSKTADKIFAQLIEDAANKPYDVADEIKMIDDRAAFLQDITDYLFTVVDWDKNDPTLQDLKAFIETHFLKCFQLVFTDGLKDPQDEKPLKAFLIKVLETIAEDTAQTAAVQQQILNELQDLRADNAVQTLQNAREYLEEVHQKLDELLKTTRKIEETVTAIDTKADKILDKLDTFTPAKRSKNLTTVPALGTFIGRKEDLKRLTEALQTSRQVVVVNGLGGIGKTTLAKAYVHAQQPHYDHVAWVSVLDTDLQTAFVNATYTDEALQHAQVAQGDTAERFGHIMRILRGLGGQNLLVIDNAEADHNLDAALPATLHWKILLTSRDQLPSYQTLPLDELSPADALALFKEYYQGQANDQTLDTLLQAINYHTLMVELLAKTLQNSDDHFDLDELLNKLNHRQLNDKKLQRKIQTEHWNNKQTQLFAHLLATFELSQVAADTYTVWVLKQFTALPPEPQPIKQLRTWLRIDETTQADFDEAIQKLHTKGWLRKTRNDRNETCYAIHRLVQDMVHYQHPITFDDAAVLVDTFTTLLDFDTSTNFPTKFKYLPPAEHLLLSLPASDENEKLEHLMNNLGIIFQEFVDLKKAKFYSEKALKSIERNFGEQHPKTAVRYSNLATVLRNLGDYEGAKSYLEKSLKSDLQNFGAQHPHTAVRYSNLGMVLRDLGDLKEAKFYLEKALQSDLQNFGEQHPNTAMCYSNLALIMRDLGDYKRAKSYLEEALQSDLKNFGEQHPNTAVSYSNLALVLRDLGDYKEAKSYLEKALQSDLKNFGEQHPNMAGRYSDLGTIMRDLGDHKGAKSYLEKALQSDLKNFGEQHPNTAIRYSNLGMVLRGLGDYKGAKSYLEKALQSGLQNFDEQHPKTAMNYSNLALVLRDLGDYKEARSYLEKALQSDLKNFGQQHPNTALRKWNLATVLFNLNRLSEAHALLTQAYATFVLRLGEQHPSTKNCLSWLNHIKERL